MTIRDAIYKNYQQGGEAWATLSEGIHPLFIQFLEQSDFPCKYVFDIGCGTGKYLKLLKNKGFIIHGIDSSQTAVDITKGVVGATSHIVCANMFEYQIPNNTYDFFISIATIHHGSKPQIKKLIDNIYEALITHGKIFITLPDLQRSEKRDTFKDHQKLSNGTFVPISGPESGLPHSFYTQAEVQKLFSKFKNLQLTLDEHGRWIIQATKN